jgi:hypothetical protein
MNWDLTQTELAKKRDKDEWHQDAWKWIFSNLNPKKPYKDEDGHMVHSMGYDLVYLLMTWTYHEKGGSYGERGAEMLRGIDFVFEKEDIPRFLKDVFTKSTKYLEEVLEKLVGMRVWATIR